MEIGNLRVMTIPYDRFKDKVKIVQDHEKNYKIEDMGSFLYMVRRKI